MTEENNQMALVELKCLSLKVKLLKHYIFTYHRYLEDKDDDNVRGKLSQITALYQSLTSIYNDCDFDREIDKELNRTKSKVGKISKNNPRTKYKMKAAVQRKDAFVEKDFSIGNTEKKDNYKKKF